MERRQALQGVLLPVLMLLATPSWAQTATSSGDIVVSGEVLAPSCGVETPSTRVVLPGVELALLQANGAVAGGTDFSVKLTGCVNVQGVRLFFDRSSPNVSAGGRLRNTTAAGATQVELELLNGQGGVIDLSAATVDGQNTGTVVAPVLGLAEVAFSVRYHATGSATPGVVTSAIPYLIDYQ